MKYANQKEKSTYSASVNNSLNDDSSIQAS
jgi:hypothetical protein